MRPTTTPREKAERILRDLKKDYPSFKVVKTKADGGFVITLPRKEVKVPISSKHSKRDDFELIISLAQKMATSMVRETIDTVVDSVISKVSANLVKELLEKMPAQKVIIERTAEETIQKTKKSFQLEEEEHYFPVDFQAGLELIGSNETSVSRKTNDMDAILEQLSGLSKDK
jgi:hypothetical protein